MRIDLIQFSHCWELNEFKFPIAGNWLNLFTIWNPTIRKWLISNSYWENWLNSHFPMLGIGWGLLLSEIPIERNHWFPIPIQRIDCKQFSHLREIIDSQFPWREFIELWNPICNMRTSPILVINVKNNLVTSRTY